MNKLKTVCGAALIGLWAVSAPAHGIMPTPSTPVIGTASWYGPGFQGRLTANGERFDQEELTAAHRSLPFGTRLRVTNQTNGKSVIVRVNDRGPYVGKRVIDLSRGAAKKIGLVKSGTGRVKLEVVPKA